MTLLTASIRVDSVDAVKAACEQAWTGGADAIELRLDRFHEPPTRLAAYLACHSEKNWILTCRSKAEGGDCALGANDRALLLSESAGSTDVIIDFEHADWQRSGEARKTLTDPNHRTAPGEPSQDRRLLLSHHNFERVPRDVMNIAENILDEPGAAIAKIAYQACDINDSFAALDLMHRWGDRMVAIAMGASGLWTRVLAKKLGAAATFACLSESSATAPGQCTLETMRSLYRWGDINADTRVFGLIGDPVAQSLSPLLHNRWFAESNINAVYLPLQVSSEPRCLDRFLTGCMDRPWLNVGGFSVTIPHKTSALKWLGERVEPECQSLGAANTLVFDGDRVTGCNTDMQAAVASLASALGCRPSELSGFSIDVLGTGGAAHAVLAGLHGVGASVTVYGRSADRVQSLVDRFGCRPASWADRVHRAGDVLINGTSVGMWPNVEASPMPIEALANLRLVFDLIYNPLESRLLTDARSTGATVLGGLDMFLRQAARQFELWTSIVPNRDTARRSLVQKLKPDGLSPKKSI